MRFDLATTVTVALGVLTPLAVLLTIGTVRGTALIEPAALTDEFGAPATSEVYVRIALVLSMLATIGGGLASALEGHDTVHQAVYGVRAEE
ncbi:MAG: hypothetical protein QOF04_2345 [Solirubrobacteraceae bacterium]|jgi:hypothetical protein|nr:hypothetical protein [Solirubrobacteraceae bacterium]